jgi:hypothetical protein
LTALTAIHRLVTRPHVPGEEEDYKANTAEVYRGEYEIAFPSALVVEVLRLTEA